MSGLTEAELRQQIGELLDVRDALSQKLRAAQHEAEALAATVGALKKDKSDLLAYVNDAERWFNRHDPNSYVSPKREAAQQHLRDARAEAGRAGFIAGAFWESNQVVDGIEQDCESEASKYAERVKAGVE